MDDHKRRRLSTTRSTKKKEPSRSQKTNALNDVLLSCTRLFPLRVFFLRRNVNQLLNFKFGFGRKKFPRHLQVKSDP